MRRKLAEWLRDRVIWQLQFIPDRMSLKAVERTPSWVWEVLKWLEDTVGRLSCWLAGEHEIVHDHCGIPEHDYCRWCSK